MKFVDVFKIHPHTTFYETFLLNRIWNINFMQFTCCCFAFRTKVIFTKPIYNLFSSAHFSTLHLNSVNPNS